MGYRVSYDGLLNTFNLPGTLIYFSGFTMSSKIYIQKEQSCPVCHETLNKPQILLNCHHEICASCLSNIQTSPGLGITCPCCRTFSSRKEIRSKDLTEHEQFQTFDINLNTVLDLPLLPTTHMLKAKKECFPMGVRELNHAAYDMLVTRKHFLLCAGNNKITVVELPFFDIARVISFESPKDIRSISELSDSKEILVASPTTGLYKLDKTWTQCSCLVEGNFSSVCVDKDVVFVLEWIKCEVCMYRVDKNSKLHELKRITNIYDGGSQWDRLKISRCDKDVIIAVTSELNGKVFLAHLHEWENTGPVNVATIQKHFEDCSIFHTTKMKGKHAFAQHVPGNEIKNPNTALTPRIYDAKKSQPKTKSTITYTAKEKPSYCSNGGATASKCIPASMCPLYNATVILETSDSRRIQMPSSESESVVQLSFSRDEVHFSFSGLQKIKCCTNIKDDKNISCALAMKDLDRKVVYLCLAGDTENAIMKFFVEY